MKISLYIFDAEGCEEYIRNSGFKEWMSFLPTTSFSDMQDRFKMHRELLTMEQIRKRIEEGYVIVPFSKNIRLIDLLKYYNLGLKTCFMTNKTFKIFRKVYKDYM